ncbi:MAG: asparagine--tRNA ligase, partial [Clostridia bacterium]|nr:asparagine--tRNA ligase [Clostridia bacterium]
MAHYLIKQLFTDMPKADINDVKVNGWVRTMRESKSFAFVELNDGTYFRNLQVVLAADKTENYQTLVKAISLGAAVEFDGTLVLTPDMKQPFELKATCGTVVGESPVDYPLQKKRHTLEYLRTIQHLRPRANLYQCGFRVRSVAAQAIHRFFHDKGYLYVHTPLITGSDCEGAGEMFRVTTLDADDRPLTEAGKTDFSKDFFGKPVSLTVSGQLNAEIFAQAFRNIYTFGPTFRAEESYTPRHAAEFWMIEPEIAFATLKEDMDLQEEMVKYIISAVLEECPEEMAFLNERVDKGLIERLQFVRDAEFVRCSYTEAIGILPNSGE